MMELIHAGVAFGTPGMDTPTVEDPSGLSGTSDLEGASGQLGSGKKDKAKKRFFSLFSSKSKEKLSSEAPVAGAAAAAAAALPVAAVSSLSANTPEAGVSVDVPTLDAPAVDVDVPALDAPAVDVPGLASREIEAPSMDMPWAPKGVYSAVQLSNLLLHLMFPLVVAAGNELFVSSCSLPDLGWCYMQLTCQKVLMLLPHQTLP